MAEQIQEKPVEKEIKSEVVEAPKKADKAHKGVSPDGQKSKVNETEKIELERIYVVNLRRQVMKAQKYRRAKKAIRTLKEFLAKHMHVENRDIRNVKVDRYLNDEIWQRGIKKPLMRVKVKAIKKNGIVYVELAEVPAFVKFKMDRENKQKNKVDEKQMKQIVKKEAEEKKETNRSVSPEGQKEESEDIKESVSSAHKGVSPEGQKDQKAKQAKHTDKPKQPQQQQIKRMALQK